MENQINVGDQNTQQIAQNPVSQPVQIPEKPKTDYFMIGGIVLACFVLFGFGGYYLGKQSGTSSLTMTKDQNSIIPTAVPAVNNPMPNTTDSSVKTTDPAVNWKKYIDNQAGFELDYPMDKFKMTSNPTKIVNTILPPETGSQADDNNGWLYIEISTNPLTEPVAVNDWVIKNWPNQDKTTQTNFKIGDIDAVMFDGGNIEPKSNKYLFIIKGNQIIQISAHYLNFSVSQGSIKNPYYDQIKSLWTKDVNQILSSFKFIN